MEFIPARFSRKLIRSIMAVTEEGKPLDDGRRRQLGLWLQALPHCFLDENGRPLTREAIADSGVASKVEQLLGGVGQELIRAQTLAGRLNVNNEHGRDFRGGLQR